MFTCSFEKRIDGQIQKMADMRSELLLKLGDTNEAIKSQERIQNQFKETLDKSREVLLETDAKQVQNTYYCKQVQSEFTELQKKMEKI